MSKTYADIIAKEIQDAGYSYGVVSADIDGKEVWVADALINGRRVVCQAETEMTAMIELQGMIAREETEES